MSCLGAEKDCGYPAPSQHIVSEAFLKHPMGASLQAVDCFPAKVCRDLLYVSLFECFKYLTYIHILSVHVHCQRVAVQLKDRNLFVDVGDSAREDIAFTALCCARIDA
jgi:hypothetical protein